MYIHHKVEVHFHQMEEVSVYLESNASGHEEKAGDLALATTLALSVLRNLGRNQTSDQCAMFLLHGRSGVEAFATGQSTGGFTLIPYPGHGGRKQITARVLVTGKAITHDLNAAGFESDGVGLGYYAPMAIFALLRYLSQKRADDPEFLDALGAIAAMSARAFVDGRASAADFDQTATAIITCACAPYFREIDRESYERAYASHGFDNKYTLMGNEFNTREASANGFHVAQSLHRDLEVGLKVWLDKQLVPEFAGAPDHLWPPDGPDRAIHEVILFVAVEASAFAVNRAYVASGQEWFAGWLLRLIEGDEVARSVIDRCLPGYLDLTRPTSRVAYTCRLSEFFPKTDTFDTFESKSASVIRLYRPVLDLRTRSAVASAFGDNELATALRRKRQAAEVQMQALALGISTSDAALRNVYVAESTAGPLVTVSRENGHRQFHFWLQEGSAARMCPASHRVTKCTVEGLFLGLERMEGSGIREVALHGGDNECHVLPLHLMRYFLADEVLGLSAIECLGEDNANSARGE